MTPSAKAPAASSAIESSRSEPEVAKAQGAEASALPKKAPPFTTDVMIAQRAADRQRESAARKKPVEPASSVATTQPASVEESANEREPSPELASKHEPAPVAAMVDSVAVEVLYSPNMLPESSGSGTSASQPGGIPQDGPTGPDRGQNRSQVPLPAIVPVKADGKPKDENAEGQV